MDETGHRCIRSVDGVKYVKNGKTKNGKQRYKCKSCGVTFLTNYCYKASKQNTNAQIILLKKEGLGIRSIGRVLNISPTTVWKRILRIADKLKPPMLAFNKVYQLDEMCTYVGKKKNQTWIAYAMCKDNKVVPVFSVGKRTNKTLRRVIDTLLLSNPKRIHTDKLKNYKYLIPKSIHRTKQYGTNHIERLNLSLRTHLKRLNRRTICFSKSEAMLVACLKIYFWS